MTRAAPRQLVFVLVASLIGLPGVVECAGDEPPSTDAPADCGPGAIYTLLRLSGKQAELRRVMVQLGEPGRAGYSMEELRRVAGINGLDLRGVLLPATTGLSNEPVLTYLRREGHGHFVVLRPVGHTGRLVQVIDPAGRPVLVDREELVRSPGWTGVVLAPSRGSPLMAIAGIILVAVGLARLGVAHYRRRCAAAPLPA